jgi:hypothetical protein
MQFVKTLFDLVQFVKILLELIRFVISLGARCRYGAVIFNSKLFDDPIELTRDFLLSPCSLE